MDEDVPHGVDSVNASCARKRERTREKSARSSGGYIAQRRRGFSEAIMDSLESRKRRPHLRSYQRIREGED